MPYPPLLLASSSPYRRERLESLGIAFETASPNTDETRLDGEPAQDLVLRLAQEKAAALRHRYPSHLIIASDQVAVMEDGTVLAKPGTATRALEQLRGCRRARVRFLSGLCLSDGSTGREYATVEPYDVVFRDLSDTAIQRYLDAERPFDCAGSFKMEGLGIVLFDRLDGRDPNALIGLPLIALEDGLQSLGISLLDYQQIR
jgi:septum formation protein